MSWMVSGSVSVPQESRNPKASPKAVATSAGRARFIRNTPITSEAATAVPMKVAVDARPAGEPNEVPPRPLPEVHPPAVLAP